MRQFSIEEISEMVREAEKAPKIVGSTTFHTKTHTYISNVFSNGMIFIESAELFPRPSVSPEIREKLKTYLDWLRKYLKDKQIKFNYVTPPL